MTRNRYISALVLALEFSILLGCWVSCEKRIVRPQKEATPYYWADSLRPHRILVVGDLQPTLWVERMVLGRAQNDAVRAGVVAATRQENPDMLLLLGDLVADGAQAADWAAFDSLMRPLAAIPTYAVIGNHDYGFLAPKGFGHFRARFPYCRTLPRLVRLADSVVLIAVDSNVDILPKSLRQGQAERYRKLLRQLDADSSVKGILVADHHPPYTNSDLATDRRIQQSFAQPFLEARKTLLFLSGHVHSYERFAFERTIPGTKRLEASEKKWQKGERAPTKKMFVVSGGGGGPRRQVDTSARRPYLNDQWRGGTLRPHNYLLVEITAAGINCRAMMLVGREFRTGDQWSVDYPQ